MRGLRDIFTLCSSLLDFGIFMDFILPHHSPAVLEQTFDAAYLYDHPLYSLMAERTELTWFLIIPKQTLQLNLGYVQNLYGEIYRLIDFIQANGLGKHFNIAKIGNKNPNQHIHLIFREEGDEIWPDAVWCHEPLKANQDKPLALKAALQVFFEKTI